MKYIKLNILLVLLLVSACSRRPSVPSHSHHEDWKRNLSLAIESGQILSSLESNPAEKKQDSITSFLSTEISRSNAIVQTTTKAKKWALPPNYKTKNRVFNYILKKQLQKINTSDEPIDKDEWSTLSLIAALLGVFVLLLGILAGIPALILGMMGYKDCENKEKRGKGFAIVGITMGILSIVLTVIFLALLIAILVI